MEKQKTDLEYYYYFFLAAGVIRLDITDIYNLLWD